MSTVIPKKRIKWQNGVVKIEKWETILGQTFLEKIDELEGRRDEIRRKIADHELQKCSDKVETYEVAQVMEFAKGLLLTKKLPNMQQLVSLFVDRVTIYPDKIHIRFNFAPQKCGLLK